MAPAWWRVRLQESHRFAMVILAVYLLARGFSALLLVELTHYQVPVSWTGPDVRYDTIVGLWDAGWYKEIATQGYPPVLPRDELGQLQQNAWAFYPLFPFLTRAFMAITGAPFAITGAMLALVLGGAAALLIAVILRAHIGTGGAIAATAVWSTCAPSPVLQVAYTESLAILLLAAVLYFLERQRWWPAAGIAVLTGLARPIAVPLGIVALVAVFVRWRRREAQPISRSEYGGMAAAVVGCGLAGLTWPVIAWWGTGVRTAYTDTMGTWRYGQDIVPLKPWVGIADYLFGPAGPWALVAAVVLIIGVAVGPWAAQLSPVLRAWILAYPLYLAVVLDPGTSLFRYLLPCFPWAAIAVDAAWRRNEDVMRSSMAMLSRWGVTAGWVLFGLATQWWWLYELWRFVPPSDFPP
ncbi:hypothetical protein KEM60_02894 [Austwickia sp. TVS 96-490-7B]|uniref:hypothetical protein n=1 Tax=Austwickia sp. TVS 96-490-7B TaxID=2830843 RepID=UPI001D78FB87|nr:hypothetical protein [Austwickia sp. TVS 96-490-7B]MBW3086665.1 hypothetical protein [Austwickia sp. TVS 96-490-7B]